jgi:hypothetical protein
MQIQEGKLGIVTHQNNAVFTKLEDKSYTLKDSKEAFRRCFQQW